MKCCTLSSASECAAHHGMALEPFHINCVLYPEKGVCADPVDKGAILGEGGGKPPHSSDKERQLAPDIGGGKT